MAEWFEDEDLWSTFYPVMFSETSFAAARDQVERIVRLTGRAGGAVLDLACGPGRHSIPFAQRGFRVTGVDRSAHLLGRAREQAAREGVEVEWVEEDMRRFRRPGAFDLALSLFSSFGYFDEPAENRAVLERVLESLAPDGLLVMDLQGKEILARNYHECSSQEVAGGGVLVDRRRVFDAWSRVESEWMLVREERVHRRSFRLWIYSAAELRALLREAGFSRVELYGGLGGEEYGPAATRLVVVAGR